MMRLEKKRAPAESGWYWDAEHLDVERRRIFHNNWIFAGLAQDLANPNDYISFTVAGTPIIVRNARGKLVAFYNICSHRHSTIHPAGNGNAPFRCPFHGWTYDAEGVPVSIPDNTRSFGFDKDDRCALALKKAEVAACGQFVFVRLSENGPSLQEWLGPFAPKLETISGTFNKVYDRLDLDWAANWKFGIEITLEGYHLPFVHPQSFSQYINSAKPQPVTSGVPEALSPFGHTEYAGPHISNVSALSATAVEWIDDVAATLHLPVAEGKGTYEHFLIYPNFMIGISSGTTLCAERYEPVAADRTEVKCWLMTGTPENPDIDKSQVWETTRQQLRDWTLSVIGEDQSACEKAQSGVKYAVQPGCLGEMEERVRHFQSAILKDMNG